MKYSSDMEEFSFLHDFVIQARNIIIISSLCIYNNNIGNIVYQH